MLCCIYSSQERAGLQSWTGYKENAIEVRQGQFGPSLNAGYDQTPANEACAQCTYTYI